MASAAQRLGRERRTPASPSPRSSRRWTRSAPRASSRPLHTDPSRSPASARGLSSSAASSARCSPGCRSSAAWPAFGGRASALRAGDDADPSVPGGSPAQAIRPRPAGWPPRWRTPPPGAADASRVRRGQPARQRGGTRPRAIGTRDSTTLGKRATQLRHPPVSTASGHRGGTMSGRFGPAHRGRSGRRWPSACRGLPAGGRARRAGAPWRGASYPPGPARVRPSARRRRARRRAGRAGQRAGGGRAGHGGGRDRVMAAAFGARRRAVTLAAGETGPDQDREGGGRRSGCARAAAGAVTAGRPVRQAHDDRRAARGMTGRWRGEFADAFAPPRGQVTRLPVAGCSRAVAGR